MSVDWQGDLRLQFQQQTIAAFFPFLQRGFGVAVTSCSVLDLLCNTLALDPEAIRSRIQTLFLNGKPVDDMAAAYVQDGDHLALSAAMPGLVGATMRSGGALAGFRRSISHQVQTVQPDSRQGIVTVKLFNLLIRELGPRFLAKGIVVAGSDLDSLLASLSAGDLGRCRHAQLDARPTDVNELTARDWASEKGIFRLQVIFA